MRSHIVFASTFPPVVCGIGTYVSYVAGAMPPGRVSVLAFDPRRYGSAVASGWASEPRVPVTYSLTRPVTDAGELANGVRGLTPAPLEDTVLWFQHAGDIWPRFPQLLAALGGFPARVVASLHWVHAASEETPWGLWFDEWRTLAEALPLLDHATVFSPAARRAVCSAFPEHAHKVSVLRHGIPVPPPISTGEAREQLRRYVEVHPQSVWPAGSSGALVDALAASRCTLVGTLGFLQWNKGFEKAFELRDALEPRLPGRSIVGLVMGVSREPDRPENRRLVAQLRDAADGERRFLVEALPPDPVFQAALRALDLVVYWPDDPTQSGRIAHAIGVGATMIGRDIEGVGEALRTVGAPACSDFDELVRRAAALLEDPAAVRTIRRRSRRHALQHSWSVQALRHLALADELISARGDPAHARAG